MIVANSEPQPTIHVRSAALTLYTMLITCYPLFSQRCIFCDLLSSSVLLYGHMVPPSGKSWEPEPGVPNFSEVILQIPL